MSLPPIPNQSATWGHDPERDVKALYEYLGRLVAALEARLAALETP